MMYLEILGIYELAWGVLFYLLLNLKSESMHQTYNVSAIPCIYTKYMISTEKHTLANENQCTIYYKYKTNSKSAHTKNLVDKQIYCTMERRERNTQFLRTQKKIVYTRKYIVLRETEMHCGNVSVEMHDALHAPT